MITLQTRNVTVFKKTKNKGFSLKEFQHVHFISRPSEKVDFHTYIYWYLYNH